MKAKRAIQSTTEIKHKNSLAKYYIGRPLGSWPFKPLLTLPILLRYSAPQLCIFLKKTLTFIHK